MIWTCLEGYLARDGAFSLARGFKERFRRTEHCPPYTENGHRDRVSVRTMSQHGQITVPGSTSPRRSQWISFETTAISHLQVRVNFMFLRTFLPIPGLRRCDPDDPLDDPLF